MNEGFCKKAAHGFTFIFLNGTYCEINISSCAEPEMSMALCLNGTICAEGPGHTLCCRSEYIYPEMITYEIMKVYKILTTYTLCNSKFEVNNSTKSFAYVLPYTVNSYQLQLDFQK